MIRGINDVLDELNALQSEISQLIGREYTVECENRIQEYEINDRQIQGMKMIFLRLQYNSFSAYTLRQPLPAET